MNEEEVRKKEALEISVKEGCASNSTVSFGDTYITPAILALNGNTVHVGIMQALVGVFSPISQLFGSKLIEKTEKRKKIILVSVAAQILLWTLIAVMPLYAYLTSNNSFPLYALIGFYVLVAIFGGIIHPSWFSWMGSLVKAEERGKYFSHRSVIVGLIGFVTIIIASIILDSFKGAGFLLVGFVILFSLAAIFRILSREFLKRQYEPSDIPNERYGLSWRKYFSRKNRVGKFSIGMAAFNFSIMIASPFFAVYLLEERNLSYFMFTIVIMSSVAWNLLFLPVVGKISDRYGNKILLRIAGILFAVTPPMWIFLQSPISIILIPQLMLGLANAAFGIGFVNYTYGISKDKERGSAIAHINAIAGIGVLLGSLIGGFILQHWRSEPMIFLVVFTVAAACRMLVTIFFLGDIKNEKRVKKLPFSWNIMHPLRMVSQDYHSIKGLITK